MHIQCIGGWGGMQVRAVAEQAIRVAPTDLDHHPPAHTQPGLGNHSRSLGRREGLRRWARLLSGRGPALREDSADAVKLSRAAAGS